MTVEFVPVSAALGAEVRDIDIRQPMPPPSGV
jgi:hypothetical protein